MTSLSHFVFSEGSEFDPQWNHFARCLLSIVRLNFWSLRLSANFFFSNFAYPIVEITASIHHKKHYILRVRNRRISIRHQAEIQYVKYSWSAQVVVKPSSTALFHMSSHWLFTGER